jgi:formylglycine-generating enzyme required for sulfatase activity
MVALPPGDFIMGVPRGAWPEDGLVSTPEPFKELSDMRRVKVREGFCISATEVTRQQYGEYVEQAGEDMDRVGDKRRTEGASDLPVTGVAYEQARAFCAWLSKAEGLNYRLPTEMEWEYACRAGSGGLYCFGDDVSLLPSYAWHKGNAGGQVHRVMQLHPNRWGLYDVHGNAWEWCSDIVPEEEKQAQNSDPRYQNEVLVRVRGGSYRSAAEACYAGGRWAALPTQTEADDVGFRVVCTVPEALLARRRPYSASP